MGLLGQLDETTHTTSVIECTRIDSYYCYHGMEVTTGRHRAKKEGIAIGAHAPLLGLGRPNLGEDRGLWGKPDGTQKGRLEGPFDHLQELNYVPLVFPCS